ncbi:MAG: glycosyltransferase family 4 protein [Prevotellaceae bacterium]|nr:glycosyltransferase family 4 protein [Prevotellaceae bacterium]
MRVLWLVNVKIPLIYKIQKSNNEINAGGWLDRISKGLINRPDTELLVCYPYSNDEKGTSGGLHYQSLVYDGKAMRLGRLNDEEGVSQAKKIISEFNPDIIHIHGTEFQYNWFFAEAAKQMKWENRIVVSIQGMVGVYADHIELGLPNSVVHASTLRERVGKKNIADGIENFLRRGVYEERTVQTTHNIIGRTTWDRACTYRINPKARYFLGNETLREVFYSGNWSYESCAKHRVFISQASYPVKGFHLFLKALKDIKRFYPDVTVHTAGTSPLGGDWINGNSYGRYIEKQMTELDLSDCIQFCGSLSADEMKKEMLEANVFVSPSTIENSPNSVGEAMLLGVPVVSSNVGGVSDLLKDKEEGYLYQSDAPYMLAYYVMEVFKDPARAAKMGQTAKAHAMRTHDYDKNLQDLIEIYEEIEKGN